ncbi:MAG: ribosome small subunit-dependent GTPase A [Bacteroidales bacterium]|nr:ribosome small subunit-dependent GTPase A [Bacteroidales bacterium]
MQGLVIRNTGSWYDVRTDDGQILQCKIKGTFRLRGIRSTNPVAVGDRVTTDGGFITDILPRRNYIIRRASNLSKQSHIIAANIDLAGLVITVAHPETSTTFIDRFIASAEAYRVPVLLIFNKADLYSDEERHYLGLVMNLYRLIGYPCVAVSAVTGEGLDKLNQLITCNITLLSGNSGVGKSTLLNRLVPGARARTARISTAHDQGQHTTTFSEMYDLPGGGAIIDTPGIRGFGTFDFQREEVSHYFREIFETGRLCRFGNCTHTHEPGCAVLQALERHEIAESRYRSYLSMLNDEDEDRYRSRRT